MIYYRAQHAFDIKQVGSLEAATGGGEGRNGLECEVRGANADTNQFPSALRKIQLLTIFLWLQTPMLSLKTKGIILISTIREMLRL